MGILNTKLILENKILLDDWKSNCCGSVWKTQTVVFAFWTNKKKDKSYQKLQVVTHLWLMNFYNVYSNHKTPLEQFKKNAENTQGIFIWMTFQCEAPSNVQHYPKPWRSYQDFDEYCRLRKQNRKISEQ